MEEIKYKSIVGEILAMPAMKNFTYSQDYVDEMKNHVDHVKHLQDLLSNFAKN